jgi:hypothetical protein
MNQRLIFSAQTLTGLLIHVTREKENRYRVNWRHIDAPSWVDIGAFSTQHKALKYAFRMVKAGQRLNFKTLSITSGENVCSDEKE